MGSSSVQRPFDLSVQAEEDLDQELEAASATAMATAGTAAAVSSELRKQRILEAESTRVQSRVLFVTSDHTVFTPGTLVQQTFIDLQDVFDEVHVLVIGTQGSVPKELVRLAPAV